MKYITRPLVTIGILATLAACAAPQEPRVIYAQPTYDKYGNAECAEPGTTGTSSTGAQLPPCVPDDCEETSTAGAANTPCVPVPNRGDPQQPRRNAAGQLI